MGRTVYLTDKEIEALKSTSEEWMSIMSEGEETFDAVDIRLKEGLGSALNKLAKGTEAERIYSKYK